MTDIYREHRTEAVERYLLGDKDTLLKNDIYYRIGDPELIPKYFNYSDFNYGKIYHPLTYLLPKEIWYIIFEMKYVIEKMDYVSFYFTPQYKPPVLLHISEGDINTKLKYFKPNTIVGMLYNDFSDVSNSTMNSETKIERAYNMVSSFKEFVNRWYLLVKEMVLQFNNDRILRRTDCPVDELFFKGDSNKGKNFVKLYHSINNKIQQFDEEIYLLEDVSEERNKLLIAKILIHDISQYVDKFLFDEAFDWIEMGIEGGLGLYNPEKRIWKLDEPIYGGWESDFYQYYFDFPSWVKTCGIESQTDLVTFMEEYSEREDCYYYNPRWFEKMEDSDDFPLWVMIQEFC